MEQHCAADRQPHALPGAEDASLDLSSASAAAEHANSSPPSPLLQAFGFMAENDSVASSVAVAAEHDGSAAAETGIGTWHPKVSTSDIKDTRKEREQTGCRVPEEAHELAREQRPASPAAEQHQAAGASAEAHEPAWPKNFIPAKCLQEMCTIYPKLVKEYVERLPLRYGGSECLVSHHDLRTLLDKACDMAIGKSKERGYERRACRAGHGAAEDAHADWKKKKKTIFEENANNALDNPIFEDGVHKGKDFEQVTEEHPDFYHWLKEHRTPRFLYFWEREYIAWFDARASDMMELVAAVEEKDGAQVSSASAAAEHANYQ